MDSLAIGIEPTRPAPERLIDPSRSRRHDGCYSPAMAERRSARVPRKVVHRHRVGAMVITRVSELLVVRGEPKAILRWIDIAGVRTPICVDLDPQRLRQVQSGPNSTFHYDGTTTDPSYYPAPALRGRRRAHSEPLPGGRRRTDP